MPVDDAAAPQDAAGAPLFPPESPRRRRAVQAARAVVACVFIALIATNLGLLNLVREQEVRRAVIETDNQARSAAGQLQRVIAEADRMLDVLVHGLHKTGLGPGVLVHVEDMMRRHVASAPLIRGVFVHDARGTLVASSADRRADINNAGRAYFRSHRDDPSPRALVGDPLVGRITGDWVIPISRRLEDAQGRFAGVAVITVSIQQLGQVLRAADHVENGEFLVTSGQTMLLRRPFGDTATGAPLPDGPLKPLLQGAPAGTLEALSGVDGKRRIYSWRRLQDPPMLVVVGVSKGHVLAAWRASAYFQTAWMALLSVALWLAIGYVVRSQRRRRTAESGLRDTRDELARANTKLAHLAQYDGLTGIPNRRYFDERLHAVFRQARREKRQLSVVMVDVDHFKRYNDRYGHLEGDHCLREIARALSGVLLRPEDFIARYGGEEIAMLLPETDCTGATAVAESARQAVLALGLEHGDSPLGQVSVSMGVASGIPAPGSSAEQFLKLADDALYQAKRAGRNQVRPRVLGDAASEAGATPLAPTA